MANVANFNTSNPHIANDSAANAVVIGLFHMTIRTANLFASLEFYKSILGLKEIHRPDFGFPGAWLACPTPCGAPIIHLYAGGPALGSGGTVPAGSAAIDHVCLACSGFHAFRSRFKTACKSWREFLVPGTTPWQLFIYDPSGVQFELTFEGTAESGVPVDMSPERCYVPGASFFEAPTP